MPKQFNKQGYDYRFLVMTRFGPDLYSIWQLFNFEFSIDTVLGIGADAVNFILIEMHTFSFEFNSVLQQILRLRC